MTTIEIPRSKIKAFLFYFVMWWRVIKPYWTSDQKWKAIGLFSLILSIFSGFIYVGIVLNDWNFRIYDAIEKLNKPAFFHELKIFAIIIFFLVVPTALANYLNNYFGYRWRQWLTNHFIEKWGKQKRFYKMMLYNNTVENIDQRIAEDVGSVCNLSLSLAVNLFVEIPKIIIFTFILLKITPHLYMEILGLKNIYAPAFITSVALIYPIISTIIIYVISAPLVQLNFLQEKLMAIFRYRLIRLREYREQIASFDSINWEEKGLIKAFLDTKLNYMQLIKRNLLVFTAHNLFGNVSTIFIMIPLYPVIFMGKLSFALFMQIRSAFATVEGSIMLIAGHFDQITSLAAVVKRLYQVQVELEHVSEHFREYNRDILYNKKTQVTCNNLDIFLPNGKMLIHKFNREFDKNKITLLTGHSGCGKSTILRTLVGAWPCANGTINMPCDSNEILLSTQKPYMPVASLRTAILYPNTSSADDKSKDLEIAKLLAFFNLEHLISRLNNSDDWLNILSLGELQRLMFIRAIMYKPKVLLMDEPVASLDSDNIKKIFDFLQRKLKNTIVIMTGHSNLNNLDLNVVNIESWKYSE